MTEKGCYVYVAAVVIDGKPTKPTKVGISAYPWGRVLGMQTGSPHRLTMLRDIPLFLHWARKIIGIHDANILIERLEGSQS